MNVTQLLSMVFLFFLLLLPAPVCAAENGADEMLRQAQKLNMTVPEKGDAALGSQESMTEMVDWLFASSRALISFFNDTMNLLGLSNTSYVKDMNDAFDIVMVQTPSI